MTIEKQVEILNQIVQVMHNSAASNYEEMSCEFDYEVYEGGWSVGAKFSFVRDAVMVSDFLDDPDDRVSDLVHQLHGLMKAHTGGDWTRCVLSVGRDGKAKTNFTY